MASQLQSKGKGKASSSRGPLDLSRLFTTKSQQERYEKYFFQKKIMKPKYGSFISFSDDVFSFPVIFENLGLNDLIREPDDFYPELVKVFYSNMVSKKGKLTSVPEVHNDDEINPPLNHPHSEAQPVQPSNQMIMEYLQGFRTDVMADIGHLSSRMDHWELSQGGFQGGGSNDGNDQ
ncbi:hypothetical protein KIW84_012644 [Lathyrus oleraceus]|uniref:Uncharacterized protein n=1 Tax=Pisum sativum TaxID=3888 RepID=A0A9D5BI41_PEA|nr:hypothetical protein KIW84_012644 [Pisum sativum]